MRQVPFAHGADEGVDLGVVFDAGGSFDAGGNVYGVEADKTTNGAGDIITRAALTPKALS